MLSPFGSENLPPAVRHRVVIVGGPDVDLRIPLIQILRDQFEIIVLGSEAQLAPAFQEIGIEYHVYPLKRGANPFRDLASLRKLYRLFKQSQPDIVHAFDTKPCVFARVAAWLAGVPVIIGTITGVGSLYLNHTLKDKLVRFIYEQLQKVASQVSTLTIFYNQADLQMFIGLGVVKPNKALVISGSGVPTDIYSPSRFTADDRQKILSDFGIPTDSIVITMISRLIRHKGILEFVEAARIITARFPQVHFLLVGGLDEDSIDRLPQAELDLIQAYTRWVGHQSNIPAILYASDIFVLLSQREGISRVLLEAASMGLPCITTNAPGCRDVVNNGVTGYIVAPQDVVQLIDALEKLIQSPQQRRAFGQASRQKVVEQFDLRVIAEQIRAVYLEKRAGLMNTPK